jgi:signal transduction histidine kinase
LREIHEKWQVEVALEGDPEGFWDPARMGQVLSNLISNAIQYSDASSPITVTILGNDPKTVNVNVHNFGTPISAKNQKIIFQSWMRGQVPEERAHLGLGLYVTKLIVEAHGGEITVTSDEKSGTTFTVQLPRRQGS